MNDNDIIRLINERNLYLSNPPIDKVKSKGRGRPSTHKIEPISDFMLSTLLSQNGVDKDKIIKILRNGGLMEGR